MPELVISNTSPLFYLHRLRQLTLLRALYQQIVVPGAVRDELHAGRIQGEDTPELADYDWITVRSVQVPEFLMRITDLGLGEAQVLALALEEPGSLVILDDRFARAVAQMRHLRLTGTAGVILKAKQEGHLEAVTPLLDRLTQMGFRLSNTVRTK
ncbi:MAG: hypothetical protein ETSY2_48740, partial [Candidatus Entotheonella gemina]